MRAARDVNDAMPRQIASQIVAAARQRGARRIACLGLSFKPNVSDVRNSPAVEVVATVAAALPEMEILAVEPHQSKLPSPLDELDNVSLATAAQAVTAADMVVRLVDHAAFRQLCIAGQAGQVL